LIDLIDKKQNGQNRLELDQIRRWIAHLTVLTFERETKEFW